MIADLYQGTTLVVPQSHENHSGFSLCAAAEAAHVVQPIGTAEAMP
jgi:hypothetical protein